MSQDLATRAELTKLARALDTTEDCVAFLGSLEAAEIHELREAASAAMHDRHRELYQSIAKASTLLPPALCVRIAERAFPPMITSKVAAEIGTDRVGEFAKRLSVGYMADVCVSIDPRKVRELISQVPVERATEVARELVDREEYVTLGRMIDAATERLVRAAVAVITSDVALLWIAFYAESEAHLTSAVRALPAERIRSVVHTALTGTAELHAAGLALIARVDDAELRGTLAGHAAEVPAEALDGLLRTVVRDGFEPELLTVLASMPEDALRRLAARDALTDRDTLLALARAAERGGHTERLRPLLEYAGPELRATLTEAGFDLG
ncbi:hypothetical protein H0B56_20415 [Haloechinothrix sp. YIM 98757]|uniref:DUF2336 domain-containing protein n=1 Tax=Haloechinothrix aidingensis TaxID=2752311 RepID=A0A838AFJ7_9PSEU|nr:hypothetical protein [Haloechinothrix aidingensis]MBA0127917.1 hypothetical protein [Haloechinothrix aidingensis]